MTTKKINFSTLLVILFWDIIIWAIGVWQGWWSVSWRSIGIAFAVFIFLVISILGHTMKKNPLNYSPNFEINNLKQGQYRRLRNLDYRASSHWKIERTDDGMWVGVKFFLEYPRLIINLSVRWIGDNEDTTPEGLQAYAKMHYEFQLGYELEKNEIVDFLGRRCVISECSGKGPDNIIGKIRRYSFVILGSEYCIQFTSGDEKSFATAEPLINSFLDQCHLAFPSLQEQTIFKDRIVIGMPEEGKQIQNEDNVSIWEILPGPINIKLYFIGLQVSERIGLDIFKKVPGFVEKKDCLSTRYRIEEHGLTVLNYSNPKNFRWAIDAVKLPSGNVIIIEVDNQGDEDAHIQGFLLEPLKRAIIASIRDTSVPYL